MDNNTRMINIDFSKSVRSDEIMDNFYEIEDQLRTERLRAAGYGVLDGFKGIHPDGTNLVIGEGRIVNKKGDIVNVPGTTLAIPALLPKEITYEKSYDEATYAVSPLGLITLKNPPYSLKKRGTIDIDYYKENYPAIEDEFFITISGTTVRAADIQDNIITVDARFRGKEATISHLRAQNRVDIITVTEDGQYNIIESVTGTESAAVKRQEYDDELVICYVKTFVSSDDYIVVYDYPPYRDVRPVYVDEKNDLYLNGILYEGAFIHFEEPIAPMLHTFWYDVETNHLYVWLETDGIEQWVVVNDLIDKLTTHVKQFTPRNFPEDMQTFMFDEEESMKFDPGLRQVTVNINNNVLMQDEFTAITELDDGVSRGIGIKLNEPLDEPAYVEVMVQRSVQVNPIRSIFERVGTYVDEGAYVYTEDAEDLDGINFTTNEAYRIGEHQLEVYKNGLRLSKNVDYTEAEGEMTELANAFTLKEKAGDGDRISYRVMTSIFSYSHMNDLLSAANEKAASAEKRAIEAEEKIANIEQALEDKITIFNSRINAVEKLFKGTEDFLTKEAIMELANLSDKVRAGLKSKTVRNVYEADNVIEMHTLTKDDFYTVMQEADGQTHLLKKEIDYEIAESTNGLKFIFTPEVTVREGIIEISGIHFGL